MCISEKYICECKWPRDTVRHCQNFVDTGVVCPGPSEMILLHGTEERKHSSGVYRCSNTSCDLWDLVMYRGIRLRGQRIDRDFGLELGRWKAEKATNALTNEANPVQSGREGHASAIVIADHSNQASDNDEGLEVPQPIEPVAAAAPEPQPVPATPEGVQHVDDSMPANIPEPEKDEATDDDLDNLFGGPSAPSSHDMSLVKNHPTIFLPTGGDLPSPALSQPTPEKPIVECDSLSPAASTTGKQSTPLILPAQAPLQQKQQQQKQRKQPHPVPQVSQNLAPKYTAKNTKAMAMDNNTPSPIGNPAVPQTATPPQEWAQVRPMRPTLSGANQATLNALRAHAPRSLHGVFSSREVLIQARMLAMASSPTPGAQRQASSRPRPPMDMSKFGGHKPAPGSQQTGNNGFVNGQGKAFKDPRKSGRPNITSMGGNMANIQQQRAMSPAVQMPPQNGYTATPQVSQRPISTYTAHNTMTMGNNMPSPMNHQQRMVPQAPGMPTQNADMAGLAGFGVPRMPGVPGIQNPAAMGVGNNMPNGDWQGMSAQEMTDQDIWLQNMLSQTTMSSNWQGMSPQSMAPQNVPHQGMPSRATTPQNGYTTSPMVPQLAPAGLNNFGLNPQMGYQGMPIQGMLPQGMSPRGMSNQGMAYGGMTPRSMPIQGMPPQNGYMSSPMAPQIRMAPTAGPNGMRAQHGLGNLTNTAAMAPSQHAGLVGQSFQPMASPASTGNWNPAGSPHPQAPPQPIFNGQMFIQQSPGPQTPQMASVMPGTPGTPGVPPTQRVVGPATGQKRSHSVISTGCVDPPMLNQPPSTPGGMPNTSLANTPQQPGAEERQAKRRAM
ncbi:hypothetical protein CSAL01_07200 [Colletotrichum salicis]|uniref:Uncharacterized protein n=1 Tax=Colletotrichum salicis TaxID=1209931 RepID=A0A135UKH6_9PEZI|nr:hypothetical protein CSAL01_07200 [Colletotrichum salicis]